MVKKQCCQNLRHAVPLRRPADTLGLHEQAREAGGTDDRELCGLLRPVLEEMEPPGPRDTAEADGTPISATLR